MAAIPTPMDTANCAMTSADRSAPEPLRSLPPDLRADAGRNPESTSAG